MHCFGLFVTHANNLSKSEYGFHSSFCSFLVATHTSRSLVKPDIVFFGENLPDAFEQRRKEDLPQ